MIATIFIAIVISTALSVWGAWPRPPSHGRSASTNDSGWPGYHTHWTQILVPKEPAP